MKKMITGAVILLIGIGIGILIGRGFLSESGQTAQTGRLTEIPEQRPSEGADATPDLTGTSAAQAKLTPAAEPKVTKMAEPEPTPAAEPKATEAVQEPTLAIEPKATEAAESEPALSTEPEPTEAAQPKLTSAAQPEPTSPAEPKATEAAQPESTPTAKEKPTEAAKPTPTAKPKATEPISPTPTPAAVLIPPQAGEEGGYYGALHVEGARLVNAEGEAVQLRGISTHGLGWFPEYVNGAMIAQLRQEWGCNVLRLAMYTAEYNGYCTSGEAQKQNLKQVIDTGVQEAARQNMYVIIDWHILSDSNPNTNKEEAKKFFAEMAEKYAAYPNVLYEICNEPNGGTGWAEIKKYALEIIPVIREYAKDAIIIVGTPTWSQDVDRAAADPITEYENIMYALHFYAATHQDSLRDKCKAAADKGLPIFVTEYGICDASGNGAINETQANKWISLLESLGISHVAWNLSNKAETSAMLKSGCGKKSGITAGDLSASGVWFVEMLKKAGLGSNEFTVPEEFTEESSGNGSSEGGGNQNDRPGWETVTAETLFEVSDGIKVTVSNGWATETGYGIQLAVTIQNTGAAEETDWVRKLLIKDGVRLTVSQCWCAQYAVENGALVLRPEDYNKTVPAGGEVSGIGIILEVQR